MSYLTENLGKRKIIMIITCIILVVVALGLYAWKGIASNREQVPNVTGYQAVANEIPKALEPMVMGSVADIIKKNNPASTDFSTTNPKIRSGSYTTTPPNSDGIIEAKFFVDSEPLRQSYLVYISYYKDSTDQFAGPPSVRCITNKNDLIYGEFACKEISPIGTSATDPLLSKLPYRDPYYFISGYIDDNDLKHVTIDIDINTNSEATRKAFQGYKESSLQWIKSQNADPNNYRIEWRNLRRTVVDQNYAVN